MGNISKPYTFAPNTTILSSQANADFDTIYNEFNGGIDASNLADNAVTTAKIPDSAVTTAKIADDAITTEKIGITPTTYTVTWTNVSGGTSSGMYYKVGRLVYFHVTYLLAGAGVSGTPSFSLPVEADTSFYLINTQVGFARYRVGSGTSFTGEARINTVTSSTTASLLVDNSNTTYVNVSLISSTVPATWANGDSIAISGTYMAGS